MAQHPLQSVESCEVVETEKDTICDSDLPRYHIDKVQHVIRIAAITHQVKAVTKPEIL